MKLMAVLEQMHSNQIADRQFLTEHRPDKAAMFGTGRILQVTQENPFKMYKVQVTALEEETRTLGHGIAEYCIPCGQFSKNFDTTTSMLHEVRFFILHVHHP